MMYDVLSANPLFIEVFSRTPHPMYVFDTQSLRFLAVNPAACAQYGYTTTEFLSMTIKDIRSPEERSKLERCLARPAPSVGGRGRWQHQRKDGGTIFTDITTCEIRFDGRPAQMVLAIDITEQVLASEQAARHIRELEATLRSAANALGTMGEVRDPYTAGHQERVSRLAAAIAGELGCDENTREGLQMMGLLHDVGKIGVPFDILSKPTTLKQQEYELVKTHVQVGYDILRAVAFKWPVAEAVLQHHERMDGSGYPNALQGHEIRLEARILAVADVVESMTCARPYRHGLGETAALDEITRGADRLYDGQVAQACKRLFDTGYRLN